MSLNKVESTQEKKDTISGRYEKRKDRRREGADRENVTLYGNENW